MGNVPSVAGRAGWLAGVALLALGTAVILGWLFHSPLAVRIAPSYSPMVMSTAVCFALLGAALLVRTTALAIRGALVLGGALAIESIALATLLEATGALTLPPVLSPLQSWLAEAQRGDMAIASAVGFAFCGALLIGAPYARSPRGRLAVGAAIAVVALIGALGLVGYLLSAQLLFPSYPFAGMALHSALGFLVAAAGLRSLDLDAGQAGRAPLRADDRITLVGAVTLVAAAVLAAIATFSVLQRTVHDMVREDLLNSMNRRADVFQDMIELREGSARIAATRPAAARNIRIIHAGKDDGSNLANIRAVVESFLKQGFSAIAYRDIDGKVVAAGGDFTAQPELKVRIATPGRAELYWRDGYLLGHQLPVYDNGERVGDVVTEQPLAVLTRLARTPAGRGESWDMGLCVKEGEGLVCFPQLLMPRVFRTSLLNIEGERLPMTRALGGEAGTVVTRDYRERYVLAAYGPVGNLGLGMVVKVDTAEILAPVREELGVALVVLLALAAAGTAVLRRQVKPLAAQLLDSERRMRELNTELDRRVLELQSANQELEAFSYSVSHDLRAPLRHISGYAEMLRAEAEHELDDSARRHLDVIRDSVSHMGKLIDSLLAFSKMGRLELSFEDVDMHALARQAIEEAERLPHQAPIEWIVAPLPAARGDVATLRQVWLNLVSNAVKYSARRAAPRIEIGCERLAEELCYSVRDNGAGFDMRYAHKLFGVFQRLHQQEEFEGTGIGLALVRRIVSRHGGRTWAEGKPGEGAAFFFTVPLLRSTHRTRDRDTT